MVILKFLAQEILMKAVNFIDRKRGDEGENIRLLTSFQKQFPYKINEVYPIRGNVFKINTSKGNFVLKGYSSYSRLKLQEAFTSSLKKEGFYQTYSFISLNQDPILYNNKYFGCLQYIEPHHRSFSYVNETERHEGLDLLDQFHRVTQYSVQRYQTILPEFNLQKKWSERWNQFHQNINVVSNYISKEIILEWLNWADWSLDGIKKHYQFIEKEPAVILHGDVAHHNFLRSKSGKLYLIDFDLISMGPSCLDLLQYANRILPFINWDITILAQYKSLNRLFSNKAFIYALAYPTDLFREWNRMLRERSSQNSWKLQQVMDQSYLKMASRQQFIMKLKSMVN